MKQVPEVDRLLRRLFGRQMAEKEAGYGRRWSGVVGDSTKYIAGPLPPAPQAATNGTQRSSAASTYRD